MGADYLKEFESVMAHICSAPNFYPTIGAPEIHKAGLKRSHFFVIYRTGQNQIVVLAVAHQRRQPAYWSGRLAKG